MTTERIRVGSVEFGGGAPLALIAGPCVIESREACLDVARHLAALAHEEQIPLVFKASYDKANRTSLNAYRGPGIDEGLDILSEVREVTHLPVLTDVHTVAEIARAADRVDILQLPAFLSRQTDLVLALGESGAVVNLKKGQFLAPWDMQRVVEKVESTGNRRILLTERGSSFGYNNLVADMRSLCVLRECGYPVIFDATHSVQQPGGAGTSTGGDGHLAPALARAAAAVGVDGIFMETHPIPAEALSDAANSVPLSRMRRIWQTLRAITAAVDGRLED